MPHLDGGQPVEASEAPQFSNHPERHGNFNVITSMPPTPSFVAYADYDAEYQAAVAAHKLPLPDGFSFTHHAPGDPEGAVLYERGSADVAVLLTWVAAVEDYVIAAHRAGDDVVAAAWLGIAALFVQTDTFRDHNDHTVELSWLDDCIVPALAGDFSNLSDLVDARVAARR